MKFEALCELLRSHGYPLNELDSDSLYESFLIKD